jgi:hypothetical protein
VLKQHPEHFNKQVLRNIRKDVDASDRFIRHNINIFTLYTRLKELMVRFREMASISIPRAT